MAKRFRTAITPSSFDRQVKTLVQQAVDAEAAGYDDIWFGDIGCPDVLTTAALVGAATERIRIGTAVIPVYTRSAPVLAATAATLDQICEGRFILGLGSSSKTMMEGWHGQDFDKPLTRIKETTELIKQIQAGQKTDFNGSVVHSHGYRQMAQSVPIYLAALRPKMIELAAEVSDGVIINLFPNDALPKIMEHVRIGAERGGKTLDDVEVVCRHQVFVCNDAKDSLEQLKKFLIGYYATSVYNAFLDWCGYSEAAAEVAAGWAARDRQRTGAALSDELLHKIGIVGDRDYCQNRIREYAAGGIDTHIITCISTDESIKSATIESFGAAQFSF